jgi:DNA modification methylase
MGIGTTALACKEMNRDFIGFELSERYIEIANERLKETQELKV